MRDGKGVPMPLRTDAMDGMVCETIMITGDKGDQVQAYTARPSGPGPFPAVVLIHHVPGWDEFSSETTRRFAQHGYIAICANLYSRFGHGTPEDVAAIVRGQGGVPDSSVMGDTQVAINWARSQPGHNGKVGVIGPCSGGRHTVLAASKLQGIDAAVDLWGGRVVQSAEELTPAQPVAPIDLTKDLSCPLLGLFGNEDRSPTAEQVDVHEAALKAVGKTYEFHRYDGAGHGFFYYDRPMFRQEQALDGWKKVWDFFQRYLDGPA